MQPPKNTTFLMRPQARAANAAGTATQAADMGRGRIRKAPARSGQSALAGTLGGDRKRGWISAFDAAIEALGSDQAVAGLHRSGLLQTEQNVGADIEAAADRHELIDVRPVPIDFPIRDGRFENVFTIRAEALAQVGLREGGLTACDAQAVAERSGAFDWHRCGFLSPLADPRKGQAGEPLALESVLSGFRALLDQSALALRDGMGAFDNELVDQPDAHACHAVNMGSDALFRTRRRAAHFDMGVGERADVQKWHSAPSLPAVGAGVGGGDDFRALVVGGPLLSQPFGKSLELSFGKSFQLVLMSVRRVLPPAVYGCRMDAQSASKSRLIALEVLESLGRFHG